MMKTIVVILALAAVAPTQLRVKPAVVCGMTLIPGDPKIDPKMLLGPKAIGINPKIRAIDPPICKP